MIRDIDADRSAQITFNEFVSMMTNSLSDRDSQEDFAKVRLKVVRDP
jgi:Ca2+-binding EF-hand superfamily protein